MINAVEQGEFDDLKDDVRTLERDFDEKVNERVADILRSLAGNMTAWPMLTLEEHLNNVVKNLEEGNI
jgi:hypothetical protein